MPIYTPLNLFPKRVLLRLFFSLVVLNKDVPKIGRRIWSNKLTQHSIIVLNPRREQWDATWEQSIHNPLFKERLDWELAGLEQADVCLFYFSPATYSPITLLELGLCAASKKCIVCCPTGLAEGECGHHLRKICTQQTETLDGLYAATLSYFNS